MVLNKHDKLIARLDAAVKSVDDELKQDIKQFVSTIHKDVVNAEPKVIQWLADNVEPAVLTFVDYILEKFK